MKNTKHTEMNDSSIEQDKQENLSQSKRKILTSIGVTSGVVGATALVPSTWVKPAVNSIILPAHAQATDLMMTTPGMDGDMMTTPGMDGDMMTTSPEPEMMGPTIEVVGYPMSMEIGKAMSKTYHVSLYPALTSSIDPNTGTMMHNTVTVMIEADPAGSAVIGSGVGTVTDIMFTSDMENMTASDGSTPILVTATAATDVPADDPDVTVTFSAEGYDDMEDTFTIVETDNLAPTMVTATAGDTFATRRTVTVKWVAPATTASVSGYVVGSSEALPADVDVDDPSAIERVFTNVPSGTHTFHVRALYSTDDNPPSENAAVAVVIA